MGIIVYKGKLSQFENKDLCFPTVVEIVVFQSKKGTRKDVGECVGAKDGFTIGNVWR